MAITVYSELKTAVANWLGRADLTTVIPDFITIAHTQLMRDLRGHLRLQKRDAAFSIATEYVAAPTDFLELVSIYLNTTPRTPVQFLTGEQATVSFPDASAAARNKPLYVNLTGATTEGTESFRFTPIPDATYTATIEYYAKLAQMSGASDTNWILTDSPDLYLYGALIQAGAYTHDGEKTSGYVQAYQSALGAVKLAGRRSRWGSNSMMVRPG